MFLWNHILIILTWKFTGIVLLKKIKIFVLNIVLIFAIWNELLLKTEVICSMT